MSSLDKVPIEAGVGILENMDKEEAFTSFQRYGDSKLLCALFMYILAPRLDPKKVTINMVCPGMVNTSMSDVLPIHLRLIMIAFKAMRARSVEVGGWIILNGALVAGLESHGKFLKDMWAETAGDRTCPWKKYAEAVNWGRHGSSRRKDYHFHFPACKVSYDPSGGCLVFVFAACSPFQQRTPKTLGPYIAREHPVVDSDNRNRVIRARLERSPGLDRFFRDQGHGAHLEPGWFLPQALSDMPGQLTVGAARSRPD
jgi:hypothetical protein